VKIELKEAIVALDSPLNDNKIGAKNVLLFSSFLEPMKLQLMKLRNQ
jgi:hypothetical protein